VQWIDGGWNNALFRATLCILVTVMAGGRVQFLVLLLYPCNHVANILCGLWYLFLASVPRSYYTPLHTPPASSGISVMSKVFHANPIEDNPYPSDHRPRKHHQRAKISTHSQGLIPLQHHARPVRPNRSEAPLPHPTDAPNPQHKQRPRRDKQTISPKHGIPQPVPLT